MPGKRIRGSLAISFVGAAVVAGLVAVSAGAHGPGNPGPNHGAEPFVDVQRYEDKEVIVVFGMGKGANKSQAPDAFDVTVPLVSSQTGQVVGSARHEPKCATDSVPCVVLEDQDTYDLGDGTIVARGRVSLPPDPDNPGFVLTAGQPDEDNIVAATGKYAGRTGRVRVYGYVDTRQAPQAFTLDEVYVIALNPR